MLTEQQELIIAEYNQSVEDAITHNKGVMAQFAEKFQRPFQAKKIIVPGVAEAFWQIAGGKLDGLCVDGDNLIRYDFSAAPHITSDAFDVYPHNNKYGFPLNHVYIFSTKIGVGSDLIYFSPEFDRAEAEEFLKNLQDKPDQPPAPHGIGWSDWRAALNERQDGISY